MDTYASVDDNCTIQIVSSKVLEQAMAANATVNRRLHH
jgi:hypothetical protein